MTRFALVLVAAALSFSCATSGGAASPGDQLLAETAKQPGAVTLPSGVVYVPLEEGTGPSPSANDVVTVKYVGWLADGTEFDSSHGQAAQFPLTSVIKCWTEAIQRMKVGGRATLVCPSKTAYGYRGAPPAVPRSATLRFEVELLGVR